MLFSDPFRDLEALASDLFGPRTQLSSRTLPMDAWKDEEALHLSFELAGVPRDAISLEVDRGTLTLTVDKPVPEVAGKRLMSERSFGRVTRSLTLGDGLDYDAVQADLSDGVLKLTIPLAEQVKPKRIAIRGGSEARELASAEGGQDSS